MTTEREAKLAADKERIFMLATKLLDALNDNGDAGANIITHAIAAVIVNLYRDGMKLTDQPDMKQAVVMADRVAEIVRRSGLEFRRMRKAIES